MKLSDKFAKEEFRGKDAKLKLTVKEIKRMAMPEMNDDFAKTLGYESLDDLNAQFTETDRD